MNVRRRELLHTAASCSAAMALLASGSAVQAAEELIIQPFSALHTANAEWIAQKLTERLADEGIGVRILIPEDEIAGIPLETFLAKDLQDTSSSVAGKLHLEIVPTVLVGGDPKSLDSTYSLATLNYGSLSDSGTAPPEKDIAQFTALPLEYAKNGMIPFGPEVDYRPVPALLAGKVDVSVGTKVKLATAVASISDDGNTLAINGIPLKDQAIAEAVQIFTYWYASTDPWIDPLQSSLASGIECIFARTIHPPVAPDPPNRPVHTEISDPGTKAATSGDNRPNSGDGVR